MATVTLLGSNAVTLDPEGRIVYCAHGDRQVVRLEANGKRTVLTSHFEGKRLRESVYPCFRRGIVSEGACAAQSQLRSNIDNPS